MNRRKFLTRTGLALTAGGLAGCSSGGSGGSGDTGATGTGGGNGGTATGTGTPAWTTVDHEAAAGLADQPRKGSLGGHLIIAFEDPSCSRCRVFARNTVPKIEQNLVSTGKAAYVSRTYPVVYQWGKPATQALEATFARSESAFWSLLDHYFSTQSEFSTSNVLDRTETFLNDNTDVDGSAVRTDADEKAYDDAVQADIDAAENAGLGEITPIVLLYTDGSYTTKASGSVSYEVVETALGES